MNRLEELVDRKGHDLLYSQEKQAGANEHTLEQFIKRFEATAIVPFYRGGVTKGYVRGVALNGLIDSIDSRRGSSKGPVVVDAGCGVGELSVYLAARGVYVIGVDVSGVAINRALRSAKKFSLEERCMFLQESLERMSIESNTIDGVIGFASLHHFIKYPKVTLVQNRI